LAALVSLAVLATIASALVASASQLGGPGSWSIDAFAEWVDADPVAAVFTAAIAVSLVVIAYLAVSALAALLAAVARLARLPRLALVADALSTPVVRRTVASLVGLGLAVAATDGSTPARAVTPAVHRAAGAEAQPAPPEDPAVATMRLLEPAGPTPAPAPADAVPVEPRAEAPPPAEPADRWTIRPGDHLWGLSERALAEAWNRPPTDAEVATYVANVIELNRDVFVVPGEPDLVIPGQVFMRPAIPR
jgi:hypothetical protein